MANKITVLADDKIPFLQNSPLTEKVNLITLPGAAITNQEMRLADALITRTRTKCTAKTLADTRIRFIATATIGFDHIDTKYCESHGIAWTNAPGCNADSVTQYMVSVLLTLAEKNHIKLAEKTIGIIGVGNVGKRIARAADALGMRVLLNDPPRAKAEGAAAFVSLETLLKESDFVTLHVPLERGGTFPTFHLADKIFFARMKPDAFFINASRGETADTTAVLNAKLAGLAIDVWENEPEISRELLAKTDIATPHIAGYSTDGKGNGTAASVHALAQYFGLSGLADWYPELPKPEQTTLQTDSLIDAVRFSYDVRSDDRKLRESPESFEHLRGSYPLRREFQAYSIRTKAPILRKVLDDLRFGK